MRHMISALVVAAMFAVLPACGGGGSDGVAGGTPTGGLLRISVTDAPFPSSYVDSASVVINEVRVRNKDVGGWETVYTGAATIDLVPLTGGVSELLVEVALAPGTYDEVRLLVDAGEVVVSDKDPENPMTRTFNVENGDLKFPSGAQTGIKVKIDNDIVVTTQLSADLMLDFDLTRSFVFNGPIKNIPDVNRVIFTPVVRATNTSTNGTVSMDVLSDNASPGDAGDDFALVGATVRLFDATQAPPRLQITSVMTDALGHAQISIVPGMYFVIVEAAAHDAATVPDPLDPPGAPDVPDLPNPPTFEIYLANLTDLGVITLVASETEIAGVVYDDSGTPGDEPADIVDDVVLEGVTVDARPAGAAGTDPITATTSTDASGAFVLSALPPGSYDLYFSKTGFADKVVLGETTVEPGTGTPVEVRMSALP